MHDQQEEAGGRTFYTIQWRQQPKVGLHYVFEDGYLVAGAEPGPARAVAPAARVGRDARQPRPSSATCWARTAR